MDKMIVSQVMRLHHKDLLRYAGANEDSVMAAYEALLHCTAELTLDEAVAYCRVCIRHVAHRERLAEARHEATLRTVAAGHTQPAYSLTDALAVRQAIDSLSSPYRETARYVYVRGLTPAQAGLRLGVSAATVADRLYRIRLQLRPQLA